MAVETRVEKYSDSVVIEDGASFISADGSSWSDAAADGANVCLKAFTADGTETWSEANASGEAGTHDGGGGGCGAAGTWAFLPALAGIYALKGPRAFTRLHTNH
jgi:hypothetical protein